MTPNHPPTHRQICDHVTKKKQRRVGAFIAESILGCGGQIVLPPGYLAAAYEHVRAAGGVCIADEVQVGFGRVGSHFWAFETQGVVPDIATLGKPMGNGFPLGGVVVRREIAQAFANGMEFFNTFGGSNLSCAVGEAVLDIIEEEALQQQALEVGGYAKRLLDGVRARHPKHVGDVRGLGLFLGLEMVEDAVRCVAFAWVRCRRVIARIYLFQGKPLPPPHRRPARPPRPSPPSSPRTPRSWGCRSVGGGSCQRTVSCSPCSYLPPIYPLTCTPKPRQISTDGPDHNVLKIKPPLCFSKRDADLLAHAIEQALVEHEKGGGEKGPHL